MRRIHLIIILVAFMCVVIQSSIMPVIRLGYVMPNFITTLFVFAGSYVSDRAILWYSVIVTGILLDVFQSGRFGAGFVALVVAVSVTELFQQQYIRRPQMVSVLVLSFIASLTFDVVGSSLLSVFLVREFGLLVGNAFYSAFLALLFVVIFSFAYETLIKRRGFSFRSVR